MAAVYVDFRKRRTTNLGKRSPAFGDCNFMPENRQPVSLYVAAGPSLETT
jgi:hypothetical protein